MLNFYVIHDCGNSDCPVVTGAGDWHHDERIHPSPLDHCDCDGLTPDHLWSETYLNLSFKNNFYMNTKNIFVILLITLGIVVLAYSGLSFTTPGKTINFLGMHIATTDSHFIPPAVGTLMLVGGIVLLVFKPKSA